MKQLLILSGKGGTGKTTTAASFIAFSKAKTFADCDVDAPNLHLVSGLPAEPERSVYYGSDKAYIDSEKCIGCGKCFSHCRFNSIRKEENKYTVNDLACEGCSVCQAVCPADAVSMQEDIAGDLMLYKNNRTFSTARLKMGRGNSGKLVSEVKNNMYTNRAEDTDVAVIDGSPGIGCPVIASVTGVNMVLVVTEPSFSGISDLERILKTCSVFGVTTAVCVNKFDTCPENTEKIEAFCKENDVPFLGKIPYDDSVSKAINEGKSIAEVDSPAHTALEEIYQKTMELIHA